MALVDGLLSKTILTVSLGNNAPYLHELPWEVRGTPPFKKLITLLKY